MTDRGEQPGPRVEQPVTAMAGGQDDPSLTWRRPSPLLLRVRRIEVALITVPLVIAGALAGTAVSGALGIGIAAAVVVAGLIGERFLARRVATWGYAERKDDLMVRRGVLIRRQSVIPYGRMQFIDVTAGPLERSLGLATLRMHTAAAASDARIPGLEQATAAVLRDQLAALGEAQAAGL
jgi:membrane protein YdbS with pleckstrin-like domain